jgi:hypothetical protein
MKFFSSMLLAACLFVLAAAVPAAARGPGEYAVQGKASASSGAYTGTASLTQTGKETWRVVWKIGNETWTGFGIGNGQIIAMNFAGQGRTGVILLVSKEDGSGYDAAWAFTGTQEVGYEEWRRRR